MNKGTIGEKKNTVGAHRNDDCMLKTRPPSVANMMSIKHSVI